MQHILCAKVGAPFGLKGALHIYPLSGQNDTLLKVNTFYIKNKSEYVPVCVQSARTHGDHLVISFEEHTNPESAAQWTQQDLYILSSDLPPLPEGQFYWYSLIGLNVIGQQGQDYGSVTECYHTNHDVLKTSQGYHIPFFMNDTIISVDFSLNQILVDYLLDSDLESDEDHD